MAHAYLQHLRIIGFIALVLLRLNLQAQPGQSKSFNKPAPPHVKGLPESAQPHISLLTHNGVGQKVTGIASRLVANSARPPDGSGSYALTPSDTADFIYSGTRGGDGTESNPMKYDTASARQWDASAGSFVPTYRDMQTYNAQNLPVTRTEQYFNGSTWINTQLETWTYTAAGKVSVYKQHYWDSALAVWVNYSRANSSYNSSGLSDNIVYERLDFGTNTLVLSEKDSYTYNGAGSVTTRQNESWDAASGSWNIRYGEVYAYTGTNLLKRYTSTTGSGLDTDYYRIYYYNAANQLSAYRGYNYGTYENDSTELFPLSPLGMPLTTTLYRFDGSSWNPRNRLINTYTASGMVSSETMQPYNLGAWGNYMRDIYFYNSFDQLVRRCHETFFNGAWVPHYNGDLDYRYYYGAYNNAVAQAGKGFGPEISLSPVPADDLLNVTLRFNQFATFSASITNVEGRLIRSWNGMGGPVYSQQVGIEGLPFGRYMLTIDCNGSRSSKPFIIKH